MTQLPTTAASSGNVLHTVHITWNDDVHSEHGSRVAQVLNEFSDTVPGLLFYRAETDLALRPNTADFGIVALFDNSSSYTAYAVDEQHQAIIAEHIAPATHTRTSVQITL